MAPGTEQLTMTANQKIALFVRMHVCVLGVACACTYARVRARVQLRFGHVSSYHNKLLCTTQALLACNRLPIAAVLPDVASHTQVSTKRRFQFGTQPR